MNARAKNFEAANELSPVVYFSQDDNLVTFRLESGKVFNMTATEARETRPRLACHLLQHRKEELELLTKVQAEAMIPDCGDRR